MSAAISRRSVSSIDVVGARRQLLRSLSCRVGDCQSIAFTTPILFRMSRFFAVLEIPNAETVVRTGVNDLWLGPGDAPDVAGARIERCWRIVAVTTDECRPAVGTGVQLGLLDAFRSLLIRPLDTAVRTGQQVRTRLCCRRVVEVGFVLPRDRCHVAGSGVK
jgi:hypothetical protein